MVAAKCLSQGGDADLAVQKIPTVGNDPDWQELQTAMTCVFLYNVADVNCSQAGS
jgi:hypothetical protein